MMSVSAAAGLIEAIKAAGANPDDVLGNLAVDKAVFSNPDSFIRVSAFAGILEEAARLSSDPCFGLHFGESYNPKNIGPLIYVVLNSPTIAAGSKTQPVILRFIMRQPEPRSLSKKTVHISDSRRTSS